MMQLTSYPFFLGESSDSLKRYYDDAAQPHVVLF